MYTTQTKGMDAMAETSTQLKDGSISFWGALAISFGNMAPAASVIFLPQAIAQFTGTRVPLAFVFAMVGAFFTASSIIYFARRFASAGAAYTFNRIAFNKVIGFSSGWMLFLAYGLNFPANMLVFGYFASGFFSQVFGLTISWLVFAAAAMLLVVFMVIRGIKTSARVDLVLLVVESVIIFVLAVVIVIHGGAHGNTMEVFSTKGSHNGWVGILFGMLYGVGAFSGFEASATVAEETRNRYRNIPLSIIVTLTIGGLFYILVAYAIAIGYGIGNGHALAVANLPLSLLADHYVGSWMGAAVNLAGMISAFGIALASSNASARVMYAMGREGVIYSWIGRLHKKYATPSYATWLIFSVSVVLVLVFGLFMRPYPNGFSAIAAGADLLGLSLYILINIGWIRLWMRERNHFHIGFIRGVIPSVLGAIIMFIPLVASVVPMPAWPLNLVIYVTIAYALVGIIIGWRAKDVPPMLKEDVVGTIPVASTEQSMHK